MSRRLVAGSAGAFAGVGLFGAVTGYLASQAGAIGPVWAWLAGIATVVFAVIGALQAGRALKVIDEVTRFVRELEAGANPEELRLPPSEKSAMLARALREMTRRLEGSVAALSRDRATFETVLASLPDPVLAVDRDMKLVYANQPANDLFQAGGEGEVYAGLIGRPAIEVLRDHDLVALFEETLRSGKAVTETVDLGLGTPRIFQATVTPIRASGARAPSGADGVEGAVCVMHDQTILRRLERIRSDFVANVSHELRTPLTAVHGFIETLQGGSYRDPARLARSLEIMHQETTRMIAIITDLLHLSRLEAPGSAPNLEPVDLGRMAAEVTELFRSSARAKGIDIAFEGEPGIPRVRADATLIRQAILNLIDNAVKYTESGGSVRVQVDRRGSEGVRVTVADTGVGIPADALERVFERFYRVDKARSRKEGGTGLGLSIVKHTVENHRGRLEIDSAPGKGTSIAFTLPLVIDGPSQTAGNER